MDYGCYASLTDMKTRIALADANDDATLRVVLEAASRWIDNHCGRHFYVKTETRYYDGKHTDELLLDEDLLSVTTLKTDEDADLTYEETWDSGDYVFGPYNSYPKMWLNTAPDGSYSFPVGQKTVEIAGLWGHGDGWSATPYADSGTTVSVATTTGTTVAAVSGAAFAALQTFLAGTEQMYITSISGNNLTVVRGVNGTTAAIQAAGTASYIYRYPDAVREACLIKAAELLMDAKAPGGSFGMAAGIGDVPVIPRNVVLHLLAPYRKIAVV